MEQSANIVGARYVLAVKNLAASAKYYKDQLGFESVWDGEGWHFLKRDKFFVMLGECADDVSAFETNNHSYFAYLDVNNIDELFSEYQLKEIEIGQPLADKPWGQREFSIRTIDGHRIMFGQAIEN